MKEDVHSFDLAETVERMRAAGTDLQSCEVKSAVGKLPKDLAESVSAFSNGSGGIIVLGLSEEEGFKPAPGFDPKRAQDALAEACYTKLTPAIRPIISIETFEEAPVLVASIPELPPRDKPCHVTTRGTYEGSFIRTGDGDRKLSHYEIDRLIEEHSQPRHDARIVEGATEDDLDKTLVDSLVERERFLHPRIFEKLGKQDILKALRVLDEDENGVLRPTLAGLLALGFYPQKYFPRLTVSFAAYPGTTKATLQETGQRFLDSNDFVGPIPVMIAEAVSAVAKNMRTGSFFEGAFREDVPDYPQEAVREAVANALMHRDYSPEAWGSQVQVNLYADRLEILNPGGLYGSVTVDTLGTLGLSSSRNEFLSKILGSTPYPQAPGKVRYVVENKGSGYVEIASQLAAAYMEPPKPHDRPGSFSLTFCKRRLTLSEQHDYSNENIENAILAMATEHETVSAKEVEEASRLSRGTVLKHINNLIRQGSPEAKEPGSSRKKRYRLTHPR